jgi:hypothetical protein
VSPQMWLMIAPWGSARASREDTIPGALMPARVRWLQLLCEGRLHTALAVMLLAAPGRLQGRLVLPGWVVAVPTLSGLVPTARRACR